MTVACFFVYNPFTSWSEYIYRIMSHLNNIFIFTQRPNFVIKNFCSWLCISNLRNSSQVQVIQLKDKCAVLEEKVQSLQIKLQRAEDDMAHSERELSAKEDVAALQSMSEENLEDLLKDPQTEIPEVSFSIQYFHFSVSALSVTD